MKNRRFLFLACIIIHFSVGAQQLDTATLKQKFNSYQESTFQEKIYIHSDKEAYLAGELIWLKIYNAEAYTIRPSAASKVAYVELLDARNKPIIQTKIELKEGRGGGSIYLPVSLESGKYTLRGYTNWMKNFDHQFYFHKELAIYNTVREEDLPAEPTKNQPAIQFFPEGGNLVAGLTSKVAFKAVDGEGRSLNFTGAIVDAQNDTILRFAPSKFGIGSFDFKPAQLTKYRAVIMPVSNKAFSAVLPKVYDKGVVMSVKRVSDILNIAIQNNLRAADEFTLFVHSGHKIAFVQKVQIGEGFNGFNVPVKELGDGISYLTLFNSANQPVSERLFFKRPEKLLNVSVSADKETYSQRERASISVNLTSKSRPVSGDFSISVYKADSLKNSDDIATNLWLTSELKGKVENPAWYFMNQDDESADNLMLTHGWRRFDLENIFKVEKQPFKYLPELQGHIISGQITNRVTGKPVSNQVAFLSVPHRRLQLYTAFSNSAGTVNFYTKDFNGTSGIIAQTDRRVDSLSTIEIIAPFSKDFADSVKTPFKMYQDKAELLKRSVAMQVNNIYLSKYLDRQIVPDADSTTFYSRPDKVYKLDDYVRFSTMEEVLREYVYEVSVALKKKSYQLRVFNSATRQYQENAPLILVDGVPVFDEGDAIMNFDPKKVQRLEVVTEPYVYGRNFFSGITSFHTYTGDLAGFELPNQGLIMDYEGLQNKRVFYSPMYEGDLANYSRTPDYRTTLFWSADNKTDEKGNATLEFFTSDIAGNYYVVVQSLSPNGEAGSKIAELQVVENSSVKTN